MRNAIRAYIRWGRLWQQRLRVLPYRILGVRITGPVRIYGKLQVHKVPGSRIIISPGTTLNASVRRNTLESRGPNILKTVRPGATISIGEDTGMTSATISSSVSVEVGRRVLLGAGVLVTDNDHHVVDPSEVQQRRYLGLPASRPGDRVIIGDDVFVGARTMILKGVVIGNGSVIGAGSVVTKNVPPFAIAAGNPCQVIRPLAGR